jgi:hypothetical protein
LREEDTKETEKPSIFPIEVITRTMILEAKAVAENDYERAIEKRKKEGMSCIPDLVIDSYFYSTRKRIYLKSRW